ncbi:uncharacterized protein LOC135097360 isoform X2 [Scylla paramamosain]|uniref:uncharacterized protein LOC135097360 isoform X2 n=1 Tax=Scylla paramamosain TaxID=85552 RepID=UPI003083AB38
MLNCSTSTFEAAVLHPPGSNSMQSQQNQMQHQYGSPNTSPHTGGVDLPLEHLPSCAPALHSPPGDIRRWNLSRPSLRNAGRISGDDDCRLPSTRRCDGARPAGTHQ